MLGDPFPNELSAKGALGAAKARLPGVLLRVSTLRKRTPISIILGAVAADMWLRGFDEHAIEKHLSKQYRKHLSSRKISAPKRAVA